MTLEQCYETIGGNYKDVLARLMKEDRVMRFVLKFLNDGSYQLLADSLAAKDYDTAFRAAHTLKGVCQNLSFDRLYESSHLITEALRSQDYTAAAQLLPRVTEDYTLTRDTISALQ